MHKTKKTNKEKETRATFIVREDLLDKVKALAYWDREMIKNIIKILIYGMKNLKKK